ncbi:MAG: DUF4428 domain-containing protein [Oscillospiraceae bacterium]|nr:DUF4428 domain-containing protein [Oscillospiraceae bacterium]
MAKHNCAICGAEVGLLSEQKLADGNFICRKVCSKKTFKIFDKVHATLDDVNAHIAQIEKGTKIWNEVFVPLQKTKNKEEKLKQIHGLKGVLGYVSPSTGLMAFIENRYKIFIFGKSTLACVYRVADLYGYDYECETKKDSEGKEINVHYCTFLFRNTTGMYAPRIELGSSADYAQIEKYFNTLFGIQKTLRNSVNNAKRQLDAIKAAANAVKGAVDGTLDEAQAADAVGAMDASVYGDRTQWIAKADAALKPYQ